MNICKHGKITAKMVFRRRHIWVGPASLFSFLLALLLTREAAAERGLPAQEGILNFGKISEVLYRGAQPDAAAITNLARLGIKAIINLRMTNDVWKPEQALAQAHGILYTNLPLRGLGRPKDEQMKTILALIGTLPGPVFVHCEYGCDRTGTVVACYRIQYDKWTAEAALGEAVRYGMSKFERGMKHYIIEFAKSVKKEPAGSGAN